MQYSRPPGTRASDHQTSKIFEEEVGEMLGPFKIPQTHSNDKLDFWVPGFYVEVKEKRQPLSGKWPLPDCAPEDGFILDELTVRRALGEFPAVWFMLRDVPLNRIFLASIAEIVCGDHVRVNRVGPPPGNVAKGKWVINLTQYRQLDDKSDVLPTILASMISLPHKQSACLIHTEL